MTRQTRTDVLQVSGVLLSVTMVFAIMSGMMVICYKLGVKDAYAKYDMMEGM